ncbi:hypothetical protein KSP39_PZI020054 [Platanthera zijinensis]|uniref:Uncharacterized protein n=1 Tax=Platanthera zijinensis TaxID=2320716 RepID=A0AAP0FWQ3_9ASPA
MKSNPEHLREESFDSMSDFPDTPPTQKVNLQHRLVSFETVNLPKLHFSPHSNEGREPHSRILFWACLAEQFVSGTTATRGELEPSPNKRSRAPACSDQNSAWSLSFQQRCYLQAPRAEHIFPPPEARSSHLAGSISPEVLAGSSRRPRLAARELVVSLVSPRRRLSSRRSSSRSSR